MLIDKKIFIGIIMLFLSFTLLTGCEDSILSGQTSFKKTGSINGTIVNEQDEFLSNVSVTIGNKTDNTGDRGIFQITSLETGEYIITAQKDGYNKFNKEIMIEEGSNSIKLTLKYEDNKNNGDNINDDSEETNIIANGKITNTKQNEVEGTWEIKKYVNEYGFSPYIEVLKNNDGSTIKTIYSQENGGRTGTLNNQSTIFFVLKMIKNNNENVYAFALIDNESFSMAVYPDNNEGEKIFNRLMETKYDFLEEELIKLIENSENVIFGKTYTIDI